MPVRCRLPESASIAQRIFYPLIRSIFFFFFAYLPYWPVRRENKPNMDGPYIWACSHHNYFCDVVPGGFEAHSPPKFLGKHTLFVWPARGFFEFCGGLPVVRPQDMNSSDGRSAQNRSSFKTAIAALQQGWGIGIYPEGVSIVRPGLVEPLKAGVAKLALSAEEASDFRLGLRIFPVGLEYGSRPRVASGLWIRYGTPIRVADYREIFERDYAAAVQALMKDLTKEMKSVFPHFETEEELAVAKKLQVVGVVENKFTFSQALARADGTFFSGVTARLLALQAASKEAGVPLAAWGHRARFVTFTPGQILWRLVVLLLGLPLVAWDILNNTIPEYLLKSVVGFVASDETEVMSFRFMTAPFVLPPIYALQFKVWTGFVLPGLSGLTFFSGWVSYALVSFVIWYAVVHWRRLFRRFLAQVFFWKDTREAESAWRALRGFVNGSTSPVPGGEDVPSSS